MFLAAWLAVVLDKLGTPDAQGLCRRAWPHSPLIPDLKPVQMRSAAAL